MNYTSESSAAKCTSLAAELSSAHGVQAHAVRVDISAEGGPELLVRAVTRNFGQEATINILVNNAGIAGNAHLHDSTPRKLTSDFHAQYATNVLAPLLLTQAVLPHLPHDRSGRIVNVSSVSASLSFEGQSVYGGTKAALESMTRTWARELRFRATVNSINPGPVATDMYGSTEPAFQRMIRPFCEISPGMQAREGLDADEVVKEVVEGGSDGKGTGGRAATPTEIAGVVGMLVSEEAGWCTGSVICANGGMRMSV